jgi:endonuclease YncB( thermonuclease family)
VRRRIVTVDWYKKDRYGRLVGTVRLRDIDIGFEQIQAGLAWHYKRYEHEQTEEDRARYATAENEARAKRRGLWQDTEPVPPWEWRSEVKKQSANQVKSTSETLEIAQ